jgi:putative ABC transport system permease protein
VGAISRGIKNAFRNGVRSISVILILSIAIGMTLIMFMSLQAVQGKIDSVKSSIGNTITVSPAGVRGFEGGGTLLTAQNVTDITALSHVASTTSILSDRLSQPGSAQPNRNGSTDTTVATNTTNLTSPITPGSFGNRQRSNSTGEAAPANFTMPVQVTGISDLNSTNSLSALGVSQFNVTSGSKIDATGTANVAMVGKDLATKNSLSVGSTFQAYGQNVSVSGIFDGGSTFTNATIVMPIKALQTLSAQPGQIDSVIVNADSIDTVSSVKDAITSKLGATTVDVTTQQDQSNSAIAPLENIKSISLYSLIGSMVAGAVILFLTMVMIVRERRREIGVLKAIGASNILVSAQFMIEALVLTILSSIIGIIAGTLLSNPVLKVLVSNNTSTAGNQGGRFAGGGGGGAIMRFGAGIAGGAQGAVRNLTANVGIEIILYGVGAAIIIAIIGSAIPAFIISKIRPAEVMRAE